VIADFVHLDDNRGPECIQGVVFAQVDDNRREGAPGPLT
jgi:hypothetical protein